MSKPTVKSIGIDEVEPHPDNPRLHDLDAIAASLERFGQTKPIIVQASTNYVVAGNGTRLAAKEKLGWTQIQALVVDFDDETARAYLAADNRTSDRARYDSQRLLGLLEGLEDLDGTGFDAQDVEVMEGVVQTVGMVGETPVTESSRAAQGDSAPPAASGKGRAAPSPPVTRPAKEPTREVVMLMTVSMAAEFGEKVGNLRKAYGAQSVVETVVRAVNEACDRL